MDSSESKTLWVGDLETWMDEAFLSSIATQLGYSQHLISLKVIRDKNTNASLKYGFLEFSSHQIALNFYQTHNSKQIPNTNNKIFKLNWAAYGSGSKSTNINKNIPKEMTVYVGDIDSSVTEHKLLAYFKQFYPTACSSKIITDNLTKRPKGYGFVSFQSSEEAQRAIIERNGQQMNGKTIKVSSAYTKINNQTVDDPKELETLASQRLKIYEKFYSLINDPQLKLEYDKQVLRTFGDGKEDTTIKKSLQNTRILPYTDTLQSEEYLNNLPRKMAFDAKISIEEKMFK